MLHIACAVLALAAADTGHAAPPPEPQAAATTAAATAGAAARGTPVSPVRLLAAGQPALAPFRPAAANAPGDTVPRPKLVDYSEAYGKRLRIHRLASYATLPLFAAQAITGEQLARKGTDAPGWAHSAHGPLAVALGGLFAVNTYTGGLNLWEGRHDPDDRTRRFAHGFLMLAADGGFAATALLANGARDNRSRRNAHRAAAYTSIGATLVGYAIMLPPLRRN
ncbi:MAG TPA: hypothetical protein VFE05_18390 [Longimicrobiaceae bacterium]|jgi:hypothetical protein|nr:hypothetical protein [Longimicrobiaceae bacterium]